MRALPGEHCLESVALERITLESIALRTIVFQSGALKNTVSTGVSCLGEDYTGDY